MNAAPCGSHPTFIGSVPEKCCRISPDLYYTISYYTISVEGTGPEGRLQAQGHLTSFAIRHRGALGTLYHKGRGRIGGAAKREEVVPTDSQFLQAQGLPTPLTIKHIGPGHSISSHPGYRQIRCFIGKRDFPPQTAADCAPEPFFPANRKPFPPDPPNPPW